MSGACYFTAWALLTIKQCIATYLIFKFEEWIWRMKEELALLRRHITARLFVQFHEWQWHFQANAGIHGATACQENCFIVPSPNRKMPIFTVIRCFPSSQLLSVYEGGQLKRQSNQEAFIVRTICNFIEANKSKPLKIIVFLIHKSLSSRQNWRELSRKWSLQTFEQGGQLSKGIATEHFTMNKMPWHVFDSRNAIRRQ